MSNSLNGEKLNRLAKWGQEWYAQQRQVLIAALEQGQPYGTRKLAPDEQVERFETMRPEDYARLLDRLSNKYKGLHNQTELVNRDLATFMSRMIVLMLNRGRLGDEEYINQVDALTEETVSG